MLQLPRCGSLVEVQATDAPTRPSQTSRQEAAVCVSGSARFEPTGVFTQYRRPNRKNSAHGGEPRQQDVRWHRAYSRHRTLGCVRACARICVVAGGNSSRSLRCLRFPSLIRIQRRVSWIGLVQAGPEHPHKIYKQEFGSMHSSGGGGSPRVRGHNRTSCPADVACRKDAIQSRRSPKAQTAGPAGGTSHTLGSSSPPHASI